MQGINMQNGTGQKERVGVAAPLHPAQPCCLPNPGFQRSQPAQGCEDGTIWPRMTPPGLATVCTAVSEARERRGVGRSAPFTQWCMPPSHVLPETFPRALSLFPLLCHAPFT